MLAIDHHLFTNHNGGQLQFGPDGDMYVAVGDGGNENDPMNNGQNTHVLLGKLLRIAPRPDGGYRIPRGNPFGGKRGRRLLRPLSLRRPVQTADPFGQPQSGHARGDRATGLSVGELASFGQDTLGRVYAVSLGGPVYRFTER